MPIDGRGNVEVKVGKNATPLTVEVVRINPVLGIVAHPGNNIAAVKFQSLALLLLHAVTK